MDRKEAQSLRELLIIRQENRAKLDAVNQNLGSALGFKYTNGQRTNHPCIIVFVPEKIEPALVPGSQIIPKQLEAEIDGEVVFCRTDVVRGGKAASEKDAPPIDADNFRIVEELRKGRIGLTGGVQLGGFDELGRGYVGTTSCPIQTADGKIHLLTNQHVAGSLGRPIYHPRPGQYAIGRTSQAIEYVTDEAHFQGIIDEKDALVRVDCAIVSLDGNAQERVKPGLHELGALGEVVPIDLGTMDVIGTEVVSIGRTRGIQTGVIAAYCYEWLDDDRWSVYTDFLIIGDEPGGAFSDHGDSGKLIATKDGLRPLALLWGGWQERLRTGYEQENWTYAIDLAKVLGYLDIGIYR
ncbi:MAG: hypothetical protein JSU86_01065 [Phycisphaerales bacterium]|nr:MAG: hypothetical protein JSU86_01065 [Phycisphaerales bacterium]